MDKSFETLVIIMSDAGVSCTARQALDLHNALLAAHWPNGIEAPAAPPLVPIAEPPPLAPLQEAAPVVPLSPEPPKPTRTRRTKAEMESARAAETPPATANPAAPASEREGSHDNPPAGAVASDGQDEIPFGRWDDAPEYPPVAALEPATQPDAGMSANDLIRDIDAQTSVADLDAWEAMAGGHLQSLLALSIGLHGKVIERLKARRAELKEAEKPEPGFFGGTQEETRDPRKIADAMKLKLADIKTKAAFAKLQSDDKADIEFLIAGSPEIWTEVKAVAMDVFKGLTT